MADGRVLPAGDRLPSPDPLAHFWAEALHYVVEPPPTGFDSWDDYYRSIGVPEDELGIGVDSIMDPNGEGPRIWFQVVPEKKSIKNRLHIDVKASGGHGTSLESRRELVEAEAARLVALGPPGCTPPPRRAWTTTPSRWLDPEGNEFDVH